MDTKGGKKYKFIKQGEIFYDREARKAKVESDADEVINIIKQETEEIEKDYPNFRIINVLASAFPQGPLTWKPDQTCEKSKMKCDNTETAIFSTQPRTGNSDDTTDLPSSNLDLASDLGTSFFNGGSYGLSGAGGNEKGRCETEGFRDKKTGGFRNKKTGGSETEGFRDQKRRGCERGGHAGKGMEGNVSERYSEDIQEDYQKHISNYGNQDNDRNNEFVYDYEDGFGNDKKKKIRKLSKVGTHNNCFLEKEFTEKESFRKPLITPRKDPLIKPLSYGRSKNIPLLPHRTRISNSGLSFPDVEDRSKRSRVNKTRGNTNNSGSWVSPTEVNGKYQRRCLEDETTAIPRLSLQGDNILRTNVINTRKPSSKQKSSGQQHLPPIAETNGITRPKTANYNELLHRKVVAAVHPDVPAGKGKLIHKDYDRNRLKKELLCAYMPKNASKKSSGESNSRHGFTGGFGGLESGESDDLPKRRKDKKKPSGEHKNIHTIFTVDSDDDDDRPVRNYGNYFGFGVN